MPHCQMRCAARSLFGNYLLAAVLLAECTDQFHKMYAPRLSPAITWWPSGLYAQHNNLASVSQRVNDSPLAMSQSRTVLSSDEERTRRRRAERVVTCRSIAYVLCGYGILDQQAV